MRTSLNELQYIEKQLHEIKKSLNRKLIWEAQLLADPKLKYKVEWQIRAYQVIRHLGRRELKKELDMIHETLISNPSNRSFKKKVRSIFLT